MDKVRFAVIGIGRMGGVHATHLLKGKVRGAVLAAVCDISDEAIQKFQKKSAKVPVFKCYKELAEKVRPDAVIVATPHYQHVEVALYFLERGINVLIEKPVAVTTYEAERLNSFLRESKGVSAAVMYNQRTNPVYKKAKKLLDEKRIGNLKRVNFIVTDWYRSQAYYNQNSWRASLAEEGGGVLINQCVHQLDILQWLVGMPESIEAHVFTKGRDITAENDVTALLRYPDDVFCSLSASAHELRGTNRIEIAGEKGRLVIGKYSMKCYTFRKSEPEVNATTKFGYGAVTRKTSRKFYGLKLVPDLLFGQQINIIRNFTRHLLFGEELISPATDGIYALSLLNGIYLSSWTKSKVDMPFDKDIYKSILEEKVKEEICLKSEENQI